MKVFGVDIGGSGIKGAPVDLDTGAFAQERVRVATQQLTFRRHAERPAGLLRPIADPQGLRTDR